MSIDEQLISNLLSDNRIKTLLTVQNKAYWESLMTATVPNRTSEVRSLPKLAFLLFMYTFSKPTSQETDDLVYKLLKTLSLPNPFQRDTYNIRTAVVE